MTKEEFGKLTVGDYIIGAEIDGAAAGSYLVIAKTHDRQFVAINTAFIGDMNQRSWEVVYSDKKKNRKLQ